MIRLYNGFLGCDRIVEFSITDKETNVGIYGAIVRKWVLKRWTINKITTSSYIIHSMFPSKPTPFPSLMINNKTPYEYELIGNIKLIIRSINRKLKDEKGWKKLKPE